MRIDSRTYGKIMAQMIILVSLLTLIWLAYPGGLDPSLTRESMSQILALSVVGSGFTASVATVAYWRGRRSK